MTGKQLAFMILFGGLLAGSISVIVEAVPLPIKDAATDAKNKPVVAPVPAGVSPSSPSVSGEMPNEVLESTPTPSTMTYINH